tara:strand:- start:65283 stop:65801 length:519 start_codon:yes stop_codon:yes gene_type:complete
MSRRTTFSAERQKNDYESLNNMNTGIVIKCTILDICGAHNPVTPYIDVELDEEGIPMEGFFGSGIHFIVFDHINKEMTNVIWKKSNDELRTCYGTDSNIVGREISLHCLANNKQSIENAIIEWEREDDILFERETCYISLSGISGATVNDWEAQMKAFEQAGIGKGRRWNRP